MGYDGYVYYNTAYGGGGLWILADGIMDCRPAIEDSEADLTTRDMRGFEAMRSGLRKWDIEIDMVWDPTIATFVAFRNAYLNRTQIGVRVFDGPVATVGSQGPVANYSVMQMNRRETLGEVQMATALCKLAQSTTAPAWHVTS